MKKTKKVNFLSLAPRVSRAPNFPLSLPLFSACHAGYPGTEFKARNKIEIRAYVFTFSVKLEKWLFDVTNSPR